ncbi:MAG: sigma-70 family RNA polymerase sigma factor [Acidobacteria bacterium]|nr:sigma-70 family RNA polymerase sigma factor [Acidobacteriota bacterium]
MSSRFLDTSTVSAESSLSLLRRAQQGDGVAVEALMARYLARLQRWASGRVPASARGLLDTSDVVQDALLGTFQRLEHFTPRHDGALMAYLRTAVANRIRMELRRRRPAATVTNDADALPSADPSPLEMAVGRAAFARYEQALAEMDEDDRAAIVGRFEMGYSYDALARAMNRPSADAARQHVARAVRRLAALMAKGEQVIDGR